jgi:cytochrome P450
MPGIGLEDTWMKDTSLTYAGAAILEAGSETVATAIETFLLYMLNNPRCLQKVRRELDIVVGQDRLPNFDDEDKLVYLQACIKECARLRPVAILGRWLISMFMQSSNEPIQGHRILVKATSM